MNRALTIAGLATVLGLGAGPAAAEHEIQHRYIVLGYVKDTAGQPRPGLVLELIRDKTGFSYLSDTDVQGFYVFIVRLGDESVGETLTLRLDEVHLQLTVRFDPSNHTDDRGTRVDLLGRRFVERAAWFRPSLARFLGDTRP